MKVVQSVIIARPIEEVFAYRSALQNACEWQPDVLASELAAPGLAGIGSRSTESRRGTNRTTESWDVEITEFKPNGVVGIVARCGSVQVAERHVFTADGGNTQYTLSVQMTGSPLTASAVQRKTVEALVHFRRQIETPRVRTVPTRGHDRSADPRHTAIRQIKTRQPLTGALSRKKCPI